MVTIEELKYIRDLAGYPSQICKNMAYLLKQDGYNVYSDEAKEKIFSGAFLAKVERFTEYSRIQLLIYEFGPFKDLP